MKYILSGGSGFIGFHFSKLLGNSVIKNFDIEKPNIPNNHSFVNILNIKELEKESVNIDDEVTFIHLAAVHFDFQNKYYETNVDGTKNILKYVEKNNIKTFVFFSSVAIYGDSEFGKKENDEKKPYNDYGKSKLMAENLIKNWHKDNQDCRVIIIRPAVVFGEFNFGNVYNLIMQIKSKIYAIIGSGKNIKSIAYVKNIVDSVIYCVNELNEKNIIYNYSDYPQLDTESLSFKISENLSIKKPFKIPLILTKLISYPIDFLEFLTSKDLKINSMRIKKFTKPTNFNSDLIRKMGFKPKYDLDNSIDRTINWIDKNNVRKLRDIWYSKAKKL